MSESKSQSAEAMTGSAAAETAVAPAPTAAPAAVAIPAPSAVPVPRLVVGTSPHVHAKEGVPEIMRWVVIALSPAVLVSLWFFGLEAFRVYVLAVGFCMAVEWACFKWLRTPGRLGDWSAALTGVLLAMNLPPTAPWWMVAAGALVAILIAKHLFGGIGSNLFNPALTARVFLLVSWPVQMTTWLAPGQRGVISSANLAAVTEATPLGLLKEGRLAELSARSTDLLLGNVGGSIGEISALALLLGGAILLARRIITWEIPVFFVGTTFAVTGLAWLFGPSGSYASPVTHLLSGGLFLGAIFMATDMVTSPNTLLGRAIFGAGCGLLTALIRLFGGYPEGVSFAILLMNGLTPLIDHYLRPRPFGEKRTVTPAVVGAGAGGKP